MKRIQLAVIRRLVSDRDNGCLCCDGPHCYGVQLLEPGGTEQVDPMKLIYDTAYNSPDGTRLLITVETIY